MSRHIDSNKIARPLVLALVLAFGAALTGASPAAAGETRCGVAQEFPTPDIAMSGRLDNVVVPAGLTCVLLFAEVRGNVVAQPGSKVFIFFSEVRGNVEANSGVLANTQESSIGGNYACDGCRLLQAFAIRIGGNIEVVGLRPFGPLNQGFGSFIESNEVGGNLTIRDSQGQAGIFDDFEVFDNIVGGNLTFANNHIDRSAAIERNVVRGNVAVVRNDGPTEVTENIIKATLECFENEPPPESAGNDARQYKGQCQA